MLKCHKCGKITRPRHYTKGMRILHYFICECGWTNKPKDVPENTESENGEE